MLYHLVALLLCSVLPVHAIVQTASRNIIQSRFTKFIAPDLVTAQQYVPLIFTRPELNMSYGINGFIRSDATYATRQIEGLVFTPLTTFWPQAQQPTLTGDANDLHTMSIANMIGSVGAWTESTVNSNNLRFFLNVTTSGQLIGDGLIHVQNAYVEYTAPTWRLLAGQYPHPLMIQTDIPRVVSYTYGAPFVARSYTPQITVQKQYADLMLSATLYSATTFASRGFFAQAFGPVTGDNSFYQFFSGTPGCTGAIWYTNALLTLALIGDFKRIIPQTFYSSPALIPGQTPTLLKFKEGENSMILSAYALLRTGNLRVQSQVTYGSNSFDFLLQGGYAVSSSTTTAFTSVPQAFKTYTGVYAASIWGTIETDRAVDDRYQPGLFVGYSKVIGTRNPIQLFETEPSGMELPYTFMLSSSSPTSSNAVQTSKILNSLIRIAPRLWVFLDRHLILGCELEISRATFGFPNNRSQPIAQPEATTLIQASISTQVYF